MIEEVRSNGQVLSKDLDESKSVVLIKHVVDVFELESCNIYKSTKLFEDLIGSLNTYCIRMAHVDYGPLWNAVG